MVDAEPHAVKPTPAAGDAPLQEHVDAVQMAEMERKDDERQGDDARPSSDPIPPPAKDQSSLPDDPAAPSSSSHPEASSDSSKGKDKDQPPALPTKESDEDSLSIEPTSTVPPSSCDNPICNITLLLPTGARHPYKIDERYLLKRSVSVPDTTEAGKKDPFSISVYTLKELILREWREEWHDKPASPSSIRLIHFGKLLDDKEQLKKYQFSRETPNVVHMSVRPAEMMEEDEAGKGKSSGREGRSREGGGGCCVIL